MTKPKELPKITRLYGIAENDGLYSVVSVSVDLEKNEVLDTHLEEAMNLESARVQFKVRVVRKVLEGSLD